MRNVLLPVAALVCLLSARPIQATSIRPPSIDDLILQSERVVEAEVISVTSAWETTPQGRVIRTHVGFRIDDTLLGKSQDFAELTFLGGTVGAQHLRVAGQPQFKVGDHSLLFIEATGNRFSPIARMAYGRLRIAPPETADAPRRVLRDNGEPLRRLTQVQDPMSELSLADVRIADGLTIEAVKSALRERAEHLGRHDLNPR